jgi:gliding motility-associated-like protein
MNIFDGRGRKIYEVKGYPIEGWDGSYDGKEVPAGTYYYVFSCPDLPPATGSVLVVR